MSLPRSLSAGSRSAAERRSAGKSRSSPNLAVIGCPAPRAPCGEAPAAAVAAPGRARPRSRLTEALASSFGQALQECSSLEGLLKIAATLARRLALQPPAARLALVSAVTRRCCALLQGGWHSAEAGLVSCAVLEDLCRGGLVSLREVQAASGEALLGLYTRARRQRSEQRQAEPRWPGATELRSQLLGVELNVQRWLQLAELFARLAEAQLLAPDCAQAAARHLELRLQEALRGASAQDLRRSVSRLADGAACLSRGTCADGQESCARDRVPLPVRAAVTSSLEAAEALAPAAAVAARDCLRGEGLLLEPAEPQEEPLEDADPERREAPHARTSDAVLVVGPRLFVRPGSSKAGHAGRRVRRSRSSGGKPTLLDPAMDSGMFWLEAAKADVRSARAGSTSFCSRRCI